jgi:propionyl-CoA synthetase
MDYNGEYIKKYDLSKLKTFHLVGERCDPDTIKWLAEKFPGIFLNDNYWQTETGWPIFTSSQPIPAQPQSLVLDSKLMF